MKQKGFVPIALLIILGVFVAGGAFVYLDREQISQEITTLKNTPNIVRPSPTAVTVAESTLTPEATLTPKITPNIKPTPTIKPAPTKTATPTPTYSTCSVNILADPSSINNAVLAAGAETKNGSYITGAQWDFDGNGTWDTEMNISNERVTHGYSNGNYIVKLKLQMSDGSITNVCSKSLSMPFGMQVSLAGTVYEDRNCNDMREPDEKALPGVKVSIVNMDGYATLAEIITDSSGHYGFNYVLSGNNAITVQPYDYPLENYGVGQFPAHSITLNSVQKTINMDLGQVPAPVADYCH